MGAGDLAAGIAAIERARQAVIEDAVAICEVPAPTFDEGERAALVRRLGAGLGLGAASVDDVGNVIWELPGDHALATVVLSAHLDTVFGMEIRPRVERRGSVLVAPGIGDNSLGVAALLHLADALRRELTHRGTLVAAANVCEEGLGNLRGMRALWDRYGSRAGIWVVLEGGTFNTVEVAGIGSRRHRITVRGPGGHSWHDFGQPSAIHGLARFIAGLSEIELPSGDRTTYNVGVISGGTSVNTIAAEAFCLLDLRSEGQQSLAQIESKVRVLADAAAASAGISLDFELVGDRAGGRLPADHWLIRLVESGAGATGVEVRWQAGSTDANVPLSHGAPAVCLGIGQGRNLHTVQEEVDTASVGPALEMAYRVIAASLQRKTRVRTPGA
ncbi:MAG: M20/M25/M40 family metallo-hydrolase [Armatimonadetes bacterium]|nr:M20/M25/M40 family metallo-hydrolase [Armatimonadota bacterium]